jgi:N-acyl homoserine lactone hydrolase
MVRSPDNSLMRMYIFGHGYIENDVAVNILNPHIGTVEDKYPPAEWHRVPSVTFLIHHPTEGWILYDTTSHPDWMHRWPEYSQKFAPPILPADETLEARLTQMGLKPSDIDWVIQSHLHQDHAGGIELFAGTKAGSRIVVHRAELERALFNVFSGQEDAKAYVRADIAGIPGIKYHVVDEEEEFAPGIEMIHLPGHTPGVIGLVLHFKNSGTIILPSDAIYMARNFGPPPVLPGIFDDSTALLASVRKVARLKKKYNARLFYPHDWIQYTTEMKLAPEFYD